jgi:predicted RNA-binding Zn-ribbon protein involved in translation (DUF1610 family)
MAVEITRDPSLHCFREESPTDACSDCGHTADEHTGCDCDEDDGTNASPRDAHPHTCSLPLKPWESQLPRISAWTCPACGKVWQPAVVRQKIAWVAQP